MAEAKIYFQGTSIPGATGNSDRPVTAADPLPVSDAASALPVPAGTNTIGNVYLASSYPVGATPIKSVATVANAIATCSLSAVASVTNFVTQIVISGSATAATVVAATLTGPTGGTMTFQVPIGTAATPSPPFIIPFTFPFPASGINIALTLTVPAAGTGAAVSAVLLGYSL